MVECKLCNLKFDNNLGLAAHIRFNHKDYNSKRYYDEFVAKVSPICICGKEKKFRNIGEGYRQFCSPQCRSNHIKPTSYWAGKKQPKDMITKRIKNTDQSLKETKRKETMIERYGVDNAGYVPEVVERIRKSNTGKSMPPRTKEHSQKIVKSKRRNGTLKHSKSARSKISRKLEEYYQTGDDQAVNLNVPKKKNGRGHKTGFHKGILYRSSYELAFIIFCEKHNIKIESCENKERRVRYISKGKKHWYYPDFFLPEHNICIEVKPNSMKNELFYIKKKYAEEVYDNYKVVSEDHIADDEVLYNYLFNC